MCMYRCIVIVGLSYQKKNPALKMVSSLSSWWAKGQRGKVCMPVRIFQWSSFSSCLYSCLYKSLMIVSLASVWILYLKVISRIFMYRMHFAKNLRCLVGILKNAKRILGKMHFANSHF